jgi:flagellar hook-length control protein FliK
LRARAAHGAFIAIAACFFQGAARQFLPGDRPKPAGRAAPADRARAQKTCEFNAFRFAAAGPDLALSLSSRRARALEATLILAALLPQAGAGMAGLGGGAAPQDGEASTFAALAALAAGEPVAAPPTLASREAASRQTAKAGAGAVASPTAQPTPAGSTTRIADDVVLVLAQSAIPDVVAAAAGANTAIASAKAGEAGELAGKTGCVEDDPEEPSSAAETAPSPGPSLPAVVAPAPPIPVSSPPESAAGRVAAEPPSLGPGPITPPAAPAAAAERDGGNGTSNRYPLDPAPTGTSAGAAGSPFPRVASAAAMSPGLTPEQTNLVLARAGAPGPAGTEPLRASVSAGGLPARPELPSEPPGRPELPSDPPPSPGPAAPPASGKAALVAPDAGNGRPTEPEPPSDTPPPAASAPGASANAARVPPAPAQSDDERAGKPEALSSDRDLGPAETAKPGPPADLQPIPVSAHPGPHAARPAETAPPRLPDQPAPAAAMIPNVPLAAVPVEVAMKSLAGVNRFEIRLHPEDLGRIDVRLDIEEDGSVQARLVVDRVETLALLQRDAKTLERAFEQAGLKPSEGGIDLTLRDPQAESRGQHRGEDRPNHSRPAPWRAPEPDPDDAAPDRIIRTLWGAAGRLDLHI